MPTLRIVVTDNCELCDKGLKSLGYLNNLFTIQKVDVEDGYEEFLLRVPVVLYEKKVLDGDVTAGELNGFLRVLSNLFIKDPTLYEFENPKIVSYVQFQRDLDVTPVERFKNGQKGHI